MGWKMQTQKTTKSKSVSVKRKEDILKTLRKLETIATKNNIPLQKKVDLMNLEMLKILKPTMN